MGPGALSEMLSALPVNINSNLLVGFDTSDDACVYKISDEIAVIQTVDFFPPIVDDPFKYGQIAAANALSDIYAMGASPALALNILCIPSCLSNEEVALIMAGGADKVKESGAVLAGGHTVEDNEPKYGLCVSAFVHPDKIWSNAGAKSGDLLILTKPLGNGILATAAKRDLITQDEFSEAVEYMAMLNKYAKEAAGGMEINACTDVTGFGFLGHAFEVAHASKVTFDMESEKIPVLDFALKLAKSGIIPGGGERNREYLTGKLNFGETVSEEMKAVLFDPQTGGGLLFSVAENDAEKLLKNLKNAGQGAFVVGKVTESSGIAINVK